MKKRKHTGGGERFWNKAYGRTHTAHLKLSTEPSEDLQKFLRWLEREHGRAYLNPMTSTLDLGCGNGRNLLYLARTYGMRGTGYDISREAIKQAKIFGEGLPLTYAVRSIGDPLPIPDASQTLVLDMMASHFLRESERTTLRNEIARVLRPDGWLFFKTFLLDEDEHAKRLLRDHPADEAGSYIHPEIGTMEHVSTEEEIERALGEHFIIHKINTSHRHLRHGRAFKRRSISVFAQKRY
ncbi:MAG: methyltransferase domain-containing protein [Parcubacteria group bacterium]|nr:methyltransferase domain-containing protein [Parcubacteria group bacterium]